MNILISGVWASNKGDRAIATFLVNKLLSVSQIDKIYVSANEPELLKKFMPNSVNVVNMGYMFKNKLMRGYCKLLCFPKLIDAVNNNSELDLSLIASNDYVNALNDADFVILTGGHHITTMREKDSLYSMTYELGLINRSKKRYILWSQTIGPLDFDKKKNKKFIYRLLKAAERVYIRDDNSDDVVRNQFPDLHNIYHSYDSVFGIKTLMHEEMREPSPDNAVGISIFYSNYKTNDEIENYEQVMSSICRKVAEYGYSIRFFPMETNEKEIQIIERIIKLSGTFDRSEIIDTNTSTIEQLASMDKCRFYIGHKTHSVIISLMLGIPLIALCYHEKTYDFMKLFGVQEYAILDKEFSQEWFEEKFKLLIGNEAEIRNRITTCGVRVSKKVNQDFEEALING